MREYNQGMTQLSQSQGWQDAYNKPALLKTGETQSERFGVYEIDSYSTITYTTKRPTSDSLANAQLVFAGNHIVDAEDNYKAGLCDGNAFWVAFDDTNGTPTAGDDVGTQSGSYKMLKDNTGFKCLAYNSSEGLCLVRPFSSGVTYGVYNLNGALNLDSYASISGDTVKYGPFANLLDSDSNPTSFSIVNTDALFIRTFTTFQAQTDDSTDKVDKVSIDYEFADADDNILLSIAIGSCTSLSGIDRLRLQTTGSYMTSGNTVSDMSQVRAKYTIGSTATGSTIEFSGTPQGEVVVVPNLDT